MFRLVTANRRCAVTPVAELAAALRAASSSEGLAGAAPRAAEGQAAGAEPGAATRGSPLADA
eukprot:9068573-Lingulodinium_polyedra.AAC.1